MEKLLHGTYVVILLVMAALTFHYFVGYRDRTDVHLPKLGSEELIDLENETILTDGANGVWSAEIPIQGVTGKYCHLIFYSIHQIVEVYQGDKLIYSMGPSPKNSFAKTPGCVWNDVLLTEDVNGTSLFVKLTCVYPHVAYDVPEFYLGEKGSILIRFLDKELFSVIISLCLIGVGLVLMGYVFYNRKNSEVDKNLILLGGLASLVGTWRVFESSLAKIVLPGLPIVSLIPFMAMMMAVIPLVLFMMNMYNSKGSKIWYVPCWVSIFVSGLSLFLQYFHLADFRQIMLPILLTLIFAILVIAVMAFLEFRRNGWNARLRSNLLGMAVVALGVLLDVMTYYRSGGRHVTSFVILGFLLYAIAMGLSIFKESGALITAGKGAQSMETLAYHDKLTGLFNRAAFIMDTDPYVVDPENFVVAVLDLNNLKYCNDNLGHEMGDKYIRDSAEIIRNTFGTIGNCYRMGGDEFYCLIPQGGKASCREQQSAMERMVDEYNAKSQDVTIAIACGFARYDNRIDYDLNSTAKRADQLMYQNKEEMKKHAN